MHFFYDLRPVGINQYPSQLVPWITHSHLRGLKANQVGIRLFQQPTGALSRFFGEDPNFIKENFNNVKSGSMVC